MGISRSVFIKRYRMQIELAVHLPWISDSSRESDSLVWHSWHPKLAGHHAQVKWESFRQEMDGNVFPSLASREGCRQLMRELSVKNTFVPEATWLACSSESLGKEMGVGTIQGLRSGPVHGAI
ncbi:MAG: N-acetyltransferase, partial [Planctomycetota bacterium]